MLILYVANIHSIETTAGVAACYLIHYLLSGFSNNDPLIVSALQTRTFYGVPRVNPDGVEVLNNELLVLNLLLYLFS